MKTLKTGDTVYVVGRNGGSVYHVHSIGGSVLIWIAIALICIVSGEQFAHCSKIVFLDRHSYFESRHYGHSSGQDQRLFVGGSHPEVRVRNYLTPNPRKANYRHPFIGYCYGVLGVVLMFSGIVSIGIVGNCTRWYIGVIALCIAALLIFGSIRLIYHALDLIDDVQIRSNANANAEA